MDNVETICIYYMQYFSIRLYDITSAPALCVETHLLHTLTFGDPLIPDLDPWVAQALQQVSRV